MGLNTLSSVWVFTLEALFKCQCLEYTTVGSFRNQCWMAGVTLLNNMPAFFEKCSTRLLSHCIVQTSLCSFC
jgi:hypothetical protein